MILQDDNEEHEHNGRRHVVGLTGFPNVGKLSSINAMFGSKKTAIALGIHYLGCAGCMLQNGADALRGLMLQDGDDQASRRLVVGLTGFPNVGKSSSINAMFGSKKTAVAATPGKTKHFQTLNVTPELTLCDCPGLVLPTYAASKADLVAAGKPATYAECYLPHHYSISDKALPDADRHARAHAMRLPRPGAANLRSVQGRPCRSR